VQSLVDPLSRTTSHAYNALNLPTVTTDPLNHPPTQTYDAASQVIQSSDTVGAVTSYAHSVGKSKGT
jgi:YD repeat-containing protein